MTDSSAFPKDCPVIDTMIGFADNAANRYSGILQQTKDQSSQEMDYPTQFMFKERPDHGGDADPVQATLQEMDRFNIEYGMIALSDDISIRACQEHPDRFIPAGVLGDPSNVSQAVNEIRVAHKNYGIRALTVFPAGYLPQVPINDPKMYPVYQTCVDLNIPVFVCAGVPGPRLRLDPQRVELIDDVMYDFPDLVFVTRHGCQPWARLAVQLMVKWPNLYYSTSAYAPEYYPEEIVQYANTRGADKIIYAGYFPMGLSLERIFSGLRSVQFRQHVWPKFLHENARRLLRIS